MKTIYRNSAQILRRRGCSLSDISSRLNISKSTVSLWTRDVVLSQFGIDRVEQSRRINMLKGHTILHNNKLYRLDLADKEANLFLDNLDLNLGNEMIALAMMYWCEGKKDDNGIGFTNSDPNLVRAFIILLNKIFKIDKSRLRICLHLHDYHKEAELINYWSIVTDIPHKQFNKTYIKKSQHKYIKEGYKGCVRISYYDAHISRIIISFAKNFIKLYI